jgi:hypothetical protein
MNLTGEQKKMIAAAVLGKMLDAKGAAMGSRERQERAFALPAVS